MRGFHRRGLEVGVEGSLVEEEKEKGDTGYAGPERKRLDELYKVIAGKTHPLILIYGNPDPDGLASAWALKEIMHATGMSATVAYTGEVGRVENETMIHVLHLPAEPLKKEALQEADLIALVDCQPDFFRTLQLPRCDIVMDHHPKKNARKVSFSDIRPNCLATSSILTEYLQTGGIQVGRRLATALYYGIQTDSRNLQRAPTRTDSKANRFLENKVNRKLLRRIEFSSYSLSRLDYFRMALIKLRYSRNVLYSHVGPVPSSDVCVQIADFLIHVKEAYWAVVSGAVGKKLIVVFRCDGIQKHAGKVAQAAFGAWGSAGGHRTIARAEMEENALPGGMILTQNERLERFVVDSLSRIEKSFRPLLRSISRIQ